MTMKRRVQINNKNLYDRLMGYNDILTSQDVKCVKELLMSGYKQSLAQYVLKETELGPGAVLYTKFRCQELQAKANYKDCEKCIQQFLNEAV